MNYKVRALAMAILPITVTACAGNSQIIEAGQTKVFSGEPCGKVEFQEASQGQVWIIDRGQVGIMGATVADFDGSILGQPSIVSYIGDPAGANVILNELEGGAAGPTIMKIGFDWLWSHKVGARDGPGNPILWEWDNAWHIEQIKHNTREVWIYRKAPGFEDTHKKLPVDPDLLDAGSYVAFEVRNNSNAPVRLTLGVGPGPSDAAKRAEKMLQELK